MKWTIVLRVLLVVLALLSVALASSPALGQTASAPTEAFKTERALTGSSGEFDLFQTILDIPAGAIVGGHWHEAGGLGTVIQGEVINRVEGQPDKLYKVGEMFPCGPGRPGHAIINAGSAPARLTIGFVVPKGAAVGGPLPAGSGIPVPTPVGPTRNAFTARSTIGGIPAEYTLVQLVRDFAPDSKTPVHTYGGPGLMMVIGGEVTVIPRGGEATVYKPGGFFVTKSGEYAQMRNSGSIPARLTSLIVLPKGAELVTALQQPTATAIPTTMPTEQPTSTIVPTMEATATTVPETAPAMTPQEQPVPPVESPAGMPRTGAGETSSFLWAVATFALVCMVVSGLFHSYRLRRR